MHRRAPAALPAAPAITRARGRQAGRPGALATARRIAAYAPPAIRQAKTAIRFGAETDLHSAPRVELEACNRMVPAEERREGVAAFNGKRAPRFQGR